MATARLIVATDIPDIGGISNSGGVSQISRTGAPGGTFNAVAHSVNAVNNTSTSGYGMRVNYNAQGAPTTGFDIAFGVISQASGNVAGASHLASWLVAMGSPSTTTNHAVFGQEINPVNRADDTGYSKTRAALSRWSGGIQLVPESQDFSGSGLTGRNITFAYGVMRSSSVNTDGNYAKSYNGLLVEKDAIAPGGRGALFSGDSSGVGANNPTSAVEIDQTWKNGIDMTSGTFSGAPLLAPLTTPTTSSATGTQGAITWDANFIYICTAANTWKRVALAAF